MLLTHNPGTELPSPEQTRRALMVIGDVLEQDACWLYGRAYHFLLDWLADDWTLTLRPESAGRFRVELQRGMRPVATLWTLAGEDRRLAGIVLHLIDRVGAHPGASGGTLDENDWREPGREPLP